jgi:hypothetical protein
MASNGERVGQQTHEHGERAPPSVGFAPASVVDTLERRGCMNEDEGRLDESRRGTCPSAQLVPESSGRACEWAERARVSSGYACE